MSRGVERVVTWSEQVGNVRLVRRGLSRWAGWIGSVGVAGLGPSYRTESERQVSWAGGSRVVDRIGVAGCVQSNGLEGAGLSIGLGTAGNGKSNGLEGAGLSTVDRLGSERYVDGNGLGRGGRS